MGFGWLAQAATEAAGGDELYVKWEQWVMVHNWREGLLALGTFLAMVLLGVVLMRMFRAFLRRNELGRATWWGILALTVYFTLLAARPGRMVDKHDLLALGFHKAIVAILLLVALRYLDRLVILPVMTRVGGVAPSRFIHQIIVTVIGVFIVVGYLSWAFGVEIGSFLAGSAVISIVLGLALQETLGNFFSGMVLQASVPFQAGDWIQVGDMEGRVVEMTWRAVTLVTNANNNVLIPNSAVAKERIVNYHTPSRTTATTVTVGLDYSIPPNDAKRVLVQAARDTDGVLADPAPGAGLASFDDSAISYTVRFWTNDPQKRGGVEQAVRVNMWYRLNQAGFNIPFPIRTVEFTNLDRKTGAARGREQTAVLEAIRGNPMLANVSPQNAQWLAGETRMFTLAEGQYFFRQDDLRDSLYLLVEGTAGVTVRTKETPPREIEVESVTSPGVVGDISAMTGRPRNATVRAKTDVRAIEVDKGLLAELFRREAGLMGRISEMVAKRQAEREEAMHKQGAEHPEVGQHGSTSVLDRMKRMFNRLG